jgi:hypothetical protein
LITTSARADWILYHKPEFSGKIIDIDTKVPIEGLVVGVQYQKATLGLGAGQITSIINVQEALTGKDGNFKIPTYTTLIQPFSWKIPTTCIIFQSWLCKS